MKEFTVYITRTMDFMQIIEAENEDQAREFALEMADDQMSNDMAHGYYNDSIDIEEED